MSENLYPELNKNSLALGLAATMPKKRGRGRPPKNRSENINPLGLVIGSNDIPEDLKSMFTGNLTSKPKEVNNSIIFDVAKNLNDLAMKRIEEDTLSKLDFEIIKTRILDQFIEIVKEKFSKGISAKYPFVSSLDVDSPFYNAFETFLKAFNEECEWNNFKEIDTITFYKAILKSLLYSLELSYNNKTY